MLLQMAFLAGLGGAGPVIPTEAEAGIPQGQPLSWRDTEWEGKRREKKGKEKSYQG